ncbi:MAG: DNA polymerase III subunit delta [Bacillota bacterium]
MHYREAQDEIRAGKFRPVYLVYGGEDFLKEELFRALRAAIVQPETADFNYHVLDPSADQLSQALALAQTQPFFAERRLVVVKDCPAIVPSRKKADDEGDGDDEKPAGGADEALLQYLKAPAPSTCLLFLAGSIDSRRKTTKALIASGGAVECQPLRDEDAVMWVQTRAQSKGKKMLSLAARGLVDKIGPDLRLLDGELEKLSLYAGDAREITPDDVESVVSNLAETEVYRLTEAVMLKQRTKALAMLEQTLRQVDHPLQLLAALTNRFRQILLVKALVERGVSKREGASQARMHPFAYEKMTGHVQGLSREEVAQALRRLLEADLAMKSGYDPKLTLETVVVELLR